MAKVLGILGTYRARSNTEIILDYILDKLGKHGHLCEKIKLKDYRIEPCTECKACKKLGTCCINDDMTTYIIPKLLGSHVIILASPVFFDNVTSLTKLFMDRTWCIKGKLKNKILGSIVVGRGYGLDFALKAIHNWGIKHQMIVADRGILGRAFEPGEILQDTRAFHDADKHIKRILELINILYPPKTSKEP